MTLETSSEVVLPSSNTFAPAQIDESQAAPREGMEGKPDQNSSLYDTTESLGLTTRDYRLPKSRSFHSQPSTSPTVTGDDFNNTTTTASPSVTILGALPSLSCPATMVQAHSGQQREVSFDISYSLLSLARSRSEPMYRTNGEAAAYGTGQQEQFNKRPEWVRDSAAPKCAQCSRSFTFWRRRHHCRACGHVFCDACSTNRITIPRLNYTTSEVRVCDHCWVREAELRYRKTSSSSSSSAPRSPTFAQLFAPLPAVHSTARQRHQRPLSLSKTSEVQINKSLLKRSLRNAATADEPTSGAVQISGVERSKEKEEETAPPQQLSADHQHGGHLRAGFCVTHGENEKENQL